MRSTVLLHHTGATIDAHYDWLIAKDVAATAPLQSYRCAARPDALAVGESMRVDRAADHRPLYLTYEGALADAGGAQPGVDRGSVQRVARGSVVSSTERPDGVELIVRWDGDDDTVTLLLHAIGSQDTVRRLR